MNVPLMRWKFLSCPVMLWNKSYVSYRPYCVLWRKYLNSSYAISILLIYLHKFIVFLYTRLRYLRSGVKVQSRMWNSVFIHCKYNTGCPAKTRILTINGTFSPFECGRHLWFSRSSGVKVQGDTLIIVLVFRKYTVWTVQLGLPNLIHTLILNQLLSFFVKIISIWGGIIFRNVRRVRPFILCLNYVMFPLVLYSPSLRQCIAIFPVAEGGCCSISDDVSCSSKKKFIFVKVRGQNSRPLSK